MVHPWHDVALPQEFTESVPVVVEIPKGSKNKYELDKDTGLLRVDRILFSSMHYPANYGFIPQTFCDDGDPLDALVLGQEPIVPLALVEARPIGVMTMRDEKGQDDKLVMVHVNDPAYKDYHDVSQLPRHVLMELEQFFKDYKTLEHKEVEVDQIQGRLESIRALRAAVELYKGKFTPR